MITLHGRANSGNVQPVAWALAELGLEFTRLDVGGKFGGNDTPEFKAMNPNGLVPVLEIDGLTLWESGAIIRYLGVKYGNEQFWPRDPGARANVDKWAEWVKTTFVPTFLAGVFVPLIPTPSAKRDQAAIAANIEKVKGLVTILESGVPAEGYFGGDDICFADIMLGTYLYRYFTLEIDRVETPKLRAYYDRLTQRPAYAEHVMVSFEDLRAK